jgi:WD40 repeat protein
MSIGRKERRAKRLRSALLVLACSALAGHGSVAAVAGQVPSDSHGTAQDMDHVKLGRSGGWHRTASFVRVLGATARTGCSQVLVQTEPGRLLVLDAFRPEVIRDMPAPAGLSGLVAAPFEDGPLIAATGDGNLIFLDGRSGLPSSTMEASRASFSSDGRLVLVGREDGPILLLETASRRMLHRFEHHDWRWFGFAPGDRLVVILTTDTPLTRKVILHDVASGRESGTWSGVRGWSGPTFSRDGLAALFPMQDRSVVLWTPGDRRTRHVWTHSGTVQSVAFSPDARQVLTGSWDRTVVARTVETGETSWSRNFEDLVASAVFDESGHFVLVQTVALNATVLEAGQGRPIRSWNGTLQARFLPGGHEALLQGQDGTWRVFGLETGQVQLDMREAQVLSIQPDGSFLLAWTPDGSASILVRDRD